MGIARLNEVRRWMVMNSTCYPRSYSMKYFCSHQSSHRVRFPYRSISAAAAFFSIPLFNKDFDVMLDLRRPFGPFCFPQNIIFHGGCQPRCFTSPQASFNHCFVCFPRDELFWLNYGGKIVLENASSKEITLRCG